MKKYFTIGMAGHIDHGKTSLTKALTNWDTDRLKEEKERSISIELGFAPLFENEDMYIAVIDVPGHERFIRQMISGVTGIDLVILVIAADEGVMPQTREHLDILNFLGVKKGIIALSKIDRVDEELLALAIMETKQSLQGTIFSEALIVEVDSLSGKGIECLREIIISELTQLENRKVVGDFRMPIDQVFTVKGQGTVVRGTIYEGRISEGDLLTILPSGKTSKARQLQVFGEKKSEVFAGQRSAINLPIEKKDVRRGEVLVNQAAHFVVSDCVDVALKTVIDLDFMIKQRMPIKCHIGTSEVMGRIVFFDRNELKEETGEVLCQLRLEQPIVSKRGDRFILRRPSPQETIGGGWIIDPNGTKYRFGQETVEQLSRKKTGTANEIVLAVLAAHNLLTISEILQYTSLNQEQLSEVIATEVDVIKVSATYYTCKTSVEKLQYLLDRTLLHYHDVYPMRLGINRAELVQTLSTTYPKVLVEYILDHSTILTKHNNQYYALSTFIPRIPKNWEKRVEQLLQLVLDDRFDIRYLADYYITTAIPANLQPEISRFLVETDKLIAIDENYYLGRIYFDQAVVKLKTNYSAGFETSQAKETLELTRKILIPLLEKMDAMGLTSREGNFRKWK